MLPASFSFSVGYTTSDLKNYTVLGNAIVISKDSIQNPLKLDLLMVTYWGQLLLTNKFTQSFRVFLIEEDGVWRIGVVKDSIFEPINDHSFLNWFKDFLVKQYENEKDTPTQMPPFSKDF